MPRRVLERPNLGENCDGSSVAVAVVQHYVDFEAYSEVWDSIPGAFGTVWAHWCLSCDGMFKNGWWRQGLCSYRSRDGVGRRWVHKFRYCGNSRTQIGQNAFKQRLPGIG